MDAAKSLETFWGLTPRACSFALQECGEAHRGRSPSPAHPPTDILALILLQRQNINVITSSLCS